MLNWHYSMFSCLEIQGWVTQQAYSCMLRVPAKQMYPKKHLERVLSIFSQKSIKVVIFFFFLQKNQNLDSLTLILQFSFFFLIGLNYLQWRWKYHSIFRAKGLSQPSECSAGTMDLCFVWGSHTNKDTFYFPLLCSVSLQELVLLSPFTL